MNIRDISVWSNCNNRHILKWSC